MPLALRLVGLALFLGACGTTPLPLTPDAIGTMERWRASAGELVYTGEVRPTGHAEPAFRYDRWIDPSGPN